MRKFNDYDKIQPYTEYQQLPAGGYVLRILQAEERPHKNGNGSSLVLAFDIAEGDYEGYYKQNFDNQKQEDKKWRGIAYINIPKDDGSEQDEWTKRKFKTIIQNIEDSNAGFHWDWDEKKLKGKFIGGLFRNEEYQKSNGEIGTTVKCCQFTTVENIRKGKFKIPADKTLSSSFSASSSPLFDEVEEKLPWEE